MPRRGFSSRLPIFLQLPATIVIWSLVGYVLPWLIYSLFHKYLPMKGPVFVGLDNIIALFTDKRLFDAVLRTLYYTGLGTAAEVLLGMAVALVLVNVIRNEVLRFAILVVFLIPMTLSEAIAAHIWLMLLTPQGYINSLLRAVGLPPVGWLSEEMALNSLILADIWQWTPLPLLLIFAARTSIPQEMYEVANLDRISPWTTFRVVTWPHIRDAVVVAALLRFILMYITIDKILLITYGGPGLATEIIGFYVFLQAFSYRNIGYAATLSFATLIAAGLITYVFWRMLTRRG